MPVFLGLRLHFLCLQTNLRGGSHYRSMEFKERKVPLFYFALPRVTSNLHTWIKGYSADLCKCHPPYHDVPLCASSLSSTVSECTFSLLCFVLWLRRCSFFALFMSLYRPQSSLSHFVISHRHIYYWVCITKAMCVCVCVVQCSYITHWPAEETGR